MPHVENPLRGRLPGAGIRAAACGNAGFQWAPTLGGECYSLIHAPCTLPLHAGFQWAPTLGGECYGGVTVQSAPFAGQNAFQWAPTLGGECYEIRSVYYAETRRGTTFQWAPTLGGECYTCNTGSSVPCSRKRFNGHPPLGVNATGAVCTRPLRFVWFQWAPTLGGECYAVVLNPATAHAIVSMGTHPWG